MSKNNVFENLKGLKIFDFKKLVNKFEYKLI